MTGSNEYIIIEGMHCPDCKSEFTLDKKHERLICSQGHKFSLQDGIPGFVDNHEFDTHWDENFTEEIPETKVIAANSFFDHIKDELLEDLKVLDAGCGDGAQAVILKRILDPKSHYYGVDISLSAVKYAAHRVKTPNTTFINGDIGSIPFKDEYFDLVFSFGVLAYTPDPYSCFQELLRTLKPGGIIGIWIYPKQKGLGGFVFSSVRKICKLGGKPVTSFIANLIVPLMGFMPTRSRMSLRNASWKQCHEIVMVNIAPQQLYFPDPDEISNWFKGQSIEVIANDENNPITLWGRKKA